MKTIAHTTLKPLHSDTRTVVKDDEEFRYDELWLGPGRVAREGFGPHRRVETAGIPAASFYRMEYYVLRSSEGVDARASRIDSLYLLYGSACRSIASGRRPDQPGCARSPRMAGRGGGGG